MKVIIPGSAVSVDRGHAVNPSTPGYTYTYASHRPQAAVVDPVWIAAGLGTAHGIDRAERPHPTHDRW